jgi:DNA-binding SARP family transcriptional activator
MQEALDALQEPVHRAVMSLYARLGRRQAALRQYLRHFSVQMVLDPRSNRKKHELWIRRTSAAGC